LQRQVAGQAPFILGNIQNFAFLLIPDIKKRQRQDSGIWQRQESFAHSVICPSVEQILQDEGKWVTLPPIDDYATLHGR
jgi:hypothetical protein